MRLRGTFRIPPDFRGFLDFMKLQRKLGQPGWPAPVGDALTPVPQVAEVCAKLPRLVGDIGSARTYVTDAVRRIFCLPVAGMLVRTGNAYVLDAVSSEEEQRAGNSALVSHAKSFAQQAIDQGVLIGFSFSHKQGHQTVIYHGLAQPLVTAQSAIALVALRPATFSEEEVTAFRILGNIARLAFDYGELANFSFAQQQHLDQLLEISTELASTSRLDSFLQKFVVRAAEFLGFERAFVAVAESGECRIRWGSINGVANQVDIHLSAVGTTQRIFETREPYVTEDANELPSDENGKLLRAEYRIKQYLGVPLLTGGGRILGILGLLDRKGERKISEEDVHRAKALGAEVGVALEATQNLHLSEQHRKRAEDLMEMALDLGSALRLPEFVNNFTGRVASMMHARNAVLALAQ